MVWLEIESKVKLKDANKLRKKIQKIAYFRKKEKRGDDYFALKKKFRRHGYPKKAFRIRNDGKNYVVNFKKWLTKYWTKEIAVKQEFEFKIKDPQPFLDLMKDLGFVEWMKKIKTTESYTHKKNKRIIIEINEVRHLGYFMEIEYLAKPYEMQKAKKIISKTLKELEINPKQINNTGYTKMLWDKGIRDKKYFMK